MKTLTVKTAERRTHSSVLSGTTREGWFVSAIVTHSAGTNGVQLSRFDDESVWTVDALFTATGLPTFVNGFGARSLVTQTLAPDFAAIVDEYIADAAVAGMAS